MHFEIEHVCEARGKLLWVRGLSPRRVLSSSSIECKLRLLTECEIHHDKAMIQPVEALVHVGRVSIGASICDQGVIHAIALHNFTPHGM